jgi:protein SCO1/2
MLGVMGIAGADKARAQSTIGDVAGDVRFDQRLGARLSPELRFRDEEGREIRLGDHLGRRPIILAPVYYQCPLLCNQVLNGLVRTLRVVTLDAGSGFDVVAVSINSAETPELAGRKRSAYLERYDRPGAERGWHFLVGDREPIDELCRTIGFRYRFNPGTGLYAHAAGIVIVTPDGRVARYFYGIDYPPKDLENEIRRAASGRIGSPIGRLLLLCYDYDAATGKYTLSIVRLLRVLGIATALSLGTFLLVMFRREQRGALANRAPRAGHEGTAEAPPLPS